MMLVTIDAQLHGTSYGRVDQYLGKYFAKDLKDGLIDAAEGQEIIDMFMLKVAEMNKPWGYGPTRSGPGYTSGQNITISGVDKQGNDAVNDVTYMILQASARLVLHDPPVSCRIHENTPPELFEAAIECTKRCGGVPTFIGDAGVIDALENVRGFEHEDALNFSIVGCVEPGGTGNDWTQCGNTGSESYFLIPNALLMGINNGTNPFQFPGAPEPHQTGPSTGYLYEMESFDEVKKAYETQVEFFARWQRACSQQFQYVMRWNHPVLIASAAIDGCMEKGKDVMAEGAKYTGCGMSAIGVGNVADGLAAIKYLCFDKKRCTTREFYDAMMANWQGDPRHEEIHAMILNEVPHFGNGDAYVDELGAYGVDVYAKAFNGKKAYNGTWDAGLFPVTAHVIFGNMSYAGPDGRYISDPFSDGIGSVQGRDVSGPTGVLSSVSTINSSSFSNGMLLNMRFSPSALSNPESQQKLADLIKTYMVDLKGQEMQLNVVSTDTMKDARKNPDEYKDLVVRIAGFSAYFVEISEEAKDDLITRTEMEEV